MFLNSVKFTPRQNWHILFQIQWNVMFDLNISFPTVFWFKGEKKRKKVWVNSVFMSSWIFFLGRKKAVESTTNPQDKYFTKVLLKHLGKHRRGICLCSYWVPDLVYPNRLCIFFSHKTAFKTKIVIHLINSFSYVYIPFTSCVYSHFSFFSIFEPDEGNWSR